MKQVSYDFNWRDVIGALITLYKVEDGFWDLGVAFEPLIGTFPKIAQEQIDERLPGFMARIPYLRLTKVNDYGVMTVKVEGGKIIHGPDPDNNGLKESSGDAGEDSNSPRENASPYAGTPYQPRLFG